MKRMIVTVGLVFSVIFALGFAHDASADGRAAGLLVSSGETSAVALIDFDESQFSQADAQNLISVLQVGVPLLQQLLASQAPGVSINVVAFTPAQMTSFGLGDADVADAFIINNFAAFAVDAYVKAVATKVAPPQGVTGQNIRLDLNLLAVAGATPQYLASLEIPERLIDQLGGFLVE